MALSLASDSSQAQSSQSTRDEWRQLMLFHYPTLLSETICVPPVHFNKVPYVRRTVPGTCQSALVLQHPSDKPPDHDVPSTSQRPISQQAQHGLWTPVSEPQATPRRVQESDILDDFAQQHVLCNLLNLGKARDEVMCILSQLNFGDYLRQPSYAAAAAQFPRPISLAQRQYRLGDFDILLIHRHYGILAGELKAVGFKPDQKDGAVRGVVKKAVGQVKKSQKVVEHLLSDIAPGLTVRGTVLLPYVPRERLQRILDTDPALKENLCQALGTENGAAATQLCVCSDDVSDPATFWDITPATLSQLSTWWEHRMARESDGETPFNDNLYVDIVARKGGPRCQRLVRELTYKVKDLHLWATSVVSSGIPPELQEEPLTTPVRSAPTILREVLPGLQRYNNVSGYNGLGIPFPGDGLAVKRLHHSSSSHTGQWPVDCVECGKQVADQLNQFGVGTDGTSLPNSPAPLQYRDVFILTRSSQLQDGFGHAASGVVHGLRQAGLPVCVLGVDDWITEKENWENNAADTAVAQTDQVTVAHFSNVSGLERKVVVWLPGRWSGVDDSYSDELIESYDRLYALSRCTTHLIVVEIP